MEAATPYGLDSLRDGRGLAVSDFDGDGDLDFIVSNYKAPAQFFVNEVAAGHWLRVRLRGRESNRDGVGAILRVRTGDRRQMRVITAGGGYASQCSRVAHFGLGRHESVDELEVTWPGGKQQTFFLLAADQIVEVDEDRDQTRVVRNDS